MYKRCIALALVTSLTLSTCNAFSPTEMTKNAVKAASTCSKKTFYKVWDHKYIALVAAIVVAGGIVVYESDYLQAKIKDILGLDSKKKK